MEINSKLLNLIKREPDSKDILLLIKQLENKSNNNLIVDTKNLKGIWELMWSNSNSKFLKYYPFIDNLQILNPSKLQAMNLIKPKGINKIIGTSILAKLNLINHNRVGVQFTHAGLIGPKIGKNKLKALAKIKKEQKGWLDIIFKEKN